MQTKEYRLAAIMFTDIAGFSKMIEQDETATFELLQRHNTIINNAAREHGGRVIKTVGDALLVEFPNTANAVKAAISVQQGIAQLNESDPPMPLYVRIGVHLGDIYFLENDALGEGINIASRLQSLAKPGRICISEDVYNLVNNKISVNVEHLGKVKLKNISRDLHAYEVAVTPAAEMPSEASAAGSGAGDRQSGPVANDGRSGAGEQSEFASLKAMVLEEIKRAGRRVSIDEIKAKLTNRTESIDRALESLADKGFLTRVKRETGRTDYGPVHPIRIPERRGGDGSGDYEKHVESQWDRALRQEQSPSGYDPLIEEYKDQTASALEKERAGFRGHLLSYLAVNGGLFFLWLTTSITSMPWFLIVALAWGIGVASHFNSVREKKRESQELDQWPDLTREQLRVYRKLVKARTAFSGHLVSNIATSVFLLALNLIVSPGFLWAAFPVGFMAIGMFSHLPAFRAKERRLIKRLRDLGARVAHLFRGRGAKDAPPPPSVAGTGPGAEAEAVKTRIMEQLNQLPESVPLGEDFVPVLDNYVEQIKMLDQKNRELDQILAGVPMAELEQDLVRLQEKRSATVNEKVLAEYDKSILQIQKQQSSFSELHNEKEIINLRLSSSLSQLRQMEIDLARMKSLSGSEEVASIGMLKDKSSELSQYLEDLRAGYAELE